MESKQAIHRRFKLNLHGLVIALVAFGPPFAAQAGPLTQLINRPKPDHATEEAVVHSYGKLPLSFEANLGQTDPGVRFLARGSGYTLLLTRVEAVLVLHRFSRLEAASKLGQIRASESGGRGARGTTARDLAPQISVLRMKLAGANSAVSVEGEAQLPGRSNYLRGRDPSRWELDVPNYADVRYRRVYPGVDLVYYGDQGKLEYDFVVAPGAGAGQIGLDFGGVRRLHLDRVTGDLVITAAGCEVRFHKPIVYQRGPEGKERIAGSFRINGRHVAFGLGNYDHSRPLVIDPTLGFSTYLGGLLDDEAQGLAVDTSDNVYLTGYTDSTDFPVTAGAYQTECGGGCANGAYDAFVTKLNSSGTALLYSTYLGGSLSDYGFGIAINAAGDAFIAGQTFSSDFPVTQGAFQGSCPDGSCASGSGFVMQLNSTGSGLVYSTYLGGNNLTQANALVLDSFGDAYVTGWTKATDFPVTTGVVQPTCGGGCRGGTSDGFVTKLNPNGTGLIYSTYLGGSSTDVSYALALDPYGSVYLTGYTESTDYPITPGAFQTTLNAPQGTIVSKLNKTGTALSYSTHLGGSGAGTTPCPSCGAAITVDSAGDAYVGGLTWETDFPVTAGALQPVYAGGFHDAYLAKFNPSGSALLYCTYLGGSDDDGIVSVAIDSSGQAYLHANTFSYDFPLTQDTYQGTFGGNSDAVFAVVSSNGSSLAYSTYLGGSQYEFAHATRTLALDAKKPPNVFITGFTDSTDFPVTSATFQTTFGGIEDGYIAKFIPSPNVGFNPVSVNFGNQNVGTASPADTVTITNIGNTALTLSGVSVTGSSSKAFAAANACKASLAPAASCAVSVRFLPKVSGTASASLSVSDNAPHSPQTVTLIGIGGSDDPYVFLSPASLTFGTQLLTTTSPAQTVTLNNTGTATLIITSITMHGDFAQTNTCGSEVAAGANCSFNVTFTPTLVNTENGTLTIADNSASSPQTVSLSGTGTQVTLTPATLSFGSVTVGQESAPQTVTLMNSGSTTVTISSIEISGANADDFTESTTCKSRLQASASCTVTITFDPVVAGPASGTLSISDSGGASPQTVSLSGTGQN
ncbi:MAG TPA: choice-of-anchor D domain-containing protein [Terriglobia bacterium]|nr:choice-of-anchor D domain-containing protein [Terriglobia bacterium]